MKKTCLLVFNPFSGATNLSSKEIKSIANSKFPAYKIDFFETTGDNDVEKILVKFKTLSPELVIIGGGDGTVKLVAKSLIDQQSVLGILPLGSANGLAKCLGINSLEEAWEVISEFRVSEIDGVDLNGELCLHLADFGINANLISKFEQDEGRGMLGYVKHSLSEIFGSVTKKFTLKTANESIELEAKMIVVANGDRYGTGALINCNGKMDDGLFEVIALNPQTAEDYIRITVEFFKGGLSEDECVKSWSLSTCEIINLEHAQFQIDGELVGKPNSLNAKIISQKFKFLTGEDFASCRTSTTTKAHLN
jgi:diacylglycerol kinase family enzyme